MSWMLWSGAVLMVGLGVFHSVMGEVYIVRRLLRRADLPKLFGGDSFTRLTIRYAWHLLSILCVGVAAVWGFAASSGAGDVSTAARILAVAVAACGAWGLVSTRARHVSWIVLLVAAGLAWSGAGPTA